MAVTVASLETKMSYNDSDFQKGMDGTESRIGKLGSIVGAGFAAAGVGAAAALSAIAASTMGMQDALTPVMTLTGKGSQQFKDMSAAISDVVAHSPKSAEELGNAAYTILSSGITDTAKATLALKDANALSLAGLGSVPQATDLITSAMNSWKDANLTSTEAAQIFFGTIAAGKTTTADLAQGFGGIAPLASALGVDLKSLMSATAALTATGMPASQAYAGLKAAFANILKPSADAEKAAKSIGVQFDASALKSKGLAGFLQEIAEKSGGSTQTLTDMFGSVEAGNAVLALTGSQAQAFADNFGIIDEKGKNLNQTAKEVAGTFSNRIKEMKNASMVHLAAIGNQGLDWLSRKWEQWGPTITRVVNTVKTDVVDAFKLIIGSFTGAGADVEGHSKGFTNFFINLGGTVRSVWDFLGTTLHQIRTAIAGFVGAFQNSDITSDGYVGVFERIGVAARAIVDWIATNWPAIRDTFMNVFNAVKDWVEANLPGILATYGNVFGTIRDIVLEVVAKVQEYWPQISQVFQAVADTVLPIADFMVTMWKAQMSQIVMIWDNGGKQILDTVFWLFGIITPAIVGGLNVIRDIFQTVTSLMKGDWGAAWDAFRSIFTDWWAGFWGTFVNSWNALWGFAGTLVSFGANLVGGLIGGIASMLGNLWAWIGTIPQGIANILINAPTFLWNTGMWLIQGLIGGIGAMAGRAADAARNVVKGAVDAAKHFLGIGSPSTVFREFGKNVGQGFIIGMDNTKHMVAMSGAALASSATSGATNHYSNTYGGPGNVSINMPPGSNGNDVVRALKDWQRINGKVPIQVGS